MLFGFPPFPALQSHLPFLETGTRSDKTLAYWEADTRARMPTDILVKQMRQVGSLLTVDIQTENARQRNWALYVMKPPV